MRQTIPLKTDGILNIESGEVREFFLNINDNDTNTERSQHGEYLQKRITPVNLTINKGGLGLAPGKLPETTEANPTDEIGKVSPTNGNKVNTGSFHERKWS